MLRLLSIAVALTGVIVPLRALASHEFDPPAGADAGRMLDASLAFEAAHQTDPEIRGRLMRWIQDRSSVSTAVGSGGRWVATDGVLTVAGGVLHRIRVGERPWAAVTPEGGWAAGGSEGVVVDGTFHADPALASALRARFVEPELPGAARSPAPGADLDAGGARAALAAVTVPRDVTVVRDTTPPTVERLELVLHPDDPARRVVVPAGAAAFVGFESVVIRVTMSERMGAPPRVVVTQRGVPPFEASLAETSANPVFEYRFFPNGSPAANGPVKIEVQGKNDGTPPSFGFDEAGNPIAPGSPGSVIGRALTVDTVPPDLRRVDVSVPGNFRSQPRENAVLPKDGFPKEILVLVADYNQPDDGSFSGANVATDLASGVDFDRAGVPGIPIAVRLFDPRGREIPGTLVASPPVALRLLLPNVYDVSAGIFPDTDADGVADPVEGRYRVQVDLVDRAGNATSQELAFGADVTPVRAASLAVSIRPVFSSPFPNPANPVPPTGTAVRRLERVEITSPDADFDPVRTTAELLTTVLGPGTVPRPMRTSISRVDRTVILAVDRDQDGDGQPDFENPAPGAFVPPGDVDPRLGRNDGPYIVQVKAFDTAGNSVVITRELVLDTTVPSVDRTFPSTEARLGPPVRIVDAILKDPRARSGRDGSGVRLDFSAISLRFLGNATTPAQFVRGIVFMHTPNDSDPTRPDYNPDDHFPKILYQIVDRQGNSTPLPRDGSFDGAFRLEVVVRDRAGNEATGVTSFTYSSRTTGTTSVLAIERLVGAPR
jgi:hypothetical protein